ncbi:MAG: TldD/PmbA family protein [Bacillota bacterium]
MSSAHESGALAKALAAAREEGLEATLSLDENASVEVLFDFNRLKGIQNTESLSYSAQTIEGGKLGLATSTKPGDESGLIRKARDLSVYGAPAAYSFPAPVAVKKPEVYSPEVANLSVEKMIEMGEEIVSFISKLHPDVNGGARIVKSVMRESIGNTKGLLASWERTTFAILSVVQLVEGQNMIDVYDYCSSTSLECDLPKMKETLAWKLDLMRKNVQIPTGAYDVLFTPATIQVLLEPILVCLNGRAVTRGISPFAGRLGEAAFSPKLTIIEDGLLDGGIGSRMYDAQGVHCRRTALIDKGVISEFLLDLDTAHRLGRKPIGTGQIGSIEPNNLVVAPGDVAMADLLSGMDRGIVIDNTMGAWAGNKYSGQVTGNISRGFLVENGKMVGRVKDCMFSANAFTHLQDNLVALSKETEQRFGAIAPYALVSNVSVTAKT